MNGIKNNGMESIIAQAIAEMESEKGKNLSPKEVNLAELERRTGISRAKLRRLQKNSFVDMPHGLAGRKASNTVLTAHTGLLDSLLVKGIKNSSVCFERLLHINCRVCGRYTSRPGRLKDRICGC